MVAYPLPRLKNPVDLVNLLYSLPANDDAAAQMGFDMRVTYRQRHRSRHPCGTAMCIGGWVQMCNPNTRQVTTAFAAYSLFFRASSQVTDDAVIRLCQPPSVFKLGVWRSHPAWCATPQQAARAVEYLIATGECDWDRAMRTA